MFNGQNPFGSYTPGSDATGNPYVGNRAEGEGGHGRYGLPNAFEGWDAASRYAFGPAQQYGQAMQPAMNYFRGEMGKDYGKELFGMSSDIAESQFRNAKSQHAQAARRSGTSGGGAVSPFMEYQLQNEAQARSGAFGEAARASVLQAEQMRTNAARGYQDTLANMYQAYMAPAYLQSSQSAQTPTGGLGPQILPAAIGAAGQVAASIPSYF